MGELGLTAVSNQVYFEVRDTQTPRAKAATSPSPSPSLKLSLQPPSPSVPQIAVTSVLDPDVGSLQRERVLSPERTPEMMTDMNKFAAIIIT